jgi:sporadic carbohydrate cluster protein (TIGR04323 family)
MPSTETEAHRQVLRGYNSHGEFGGFRIPASVQNLVMRDYTARNGYTFKLSVDEHAFPGCYMRLNAIVDELGEVDGLIMCSAHMLPQRPSVRRALLERAISHGAEIHCVLESVVVRDSADIAALEELFYLSDTLENCPDSIPEALLGDAKGNVNFA